MHKLWRKFEKVPESSCNFLKNFLYLYSVIPKILLEKKTILEHISSNFELIWKIQVNFYKFMGKFSKNLKKFEKKYVVLWRFLKLGWNFKKNLQKSWKNFHYVFGKYCTNFGESLKKYLKVPVIFSKISYSVIPKILSEKKQFWKIFHQILS